MKSLHLLTSTAVATVCASIAQAGGWVAPVIEAAPQIVATSGDAPSAAWWIGGALIACAIFCRGGGDRATLPPGDHGGSCFREGTLISTDTGWKPVETLAVGDLVATSQGVQPILSVESWMPVEYKDRPAIIEGIWLSQNHCIAIGGRRVPAGNATGQRGMCDGARYYHILTHAHSWLLATAVEDGPVVLAESMMLTADIKPLAERFPHLVELHAAHPCDASVAA